jgi:hypothetical protein
MKVLSRLFYVTQAPLFFIYMLIPPLWLLDMPYWIFTKRNLMDDWCKYNEV